MGLAGRLVSRTPVPQLEAELGMAAARRLVLLQLQVRGTNRVLSEALERTVVRARELKVDVVPLKHAALWLAGHVQEGERDARDVDVLVAAGGARALWLALQRDGYLPLAEDAGAVHLPPLLARSGACVEIHERIWGMRLDATGGASLAAVGLTREAPSGPHLRLPGRAFLIAHALVHGLAQHLTSPAAYAPVRVLADLSSVRATLADAEQVSALVASSLDAETVEAALVLVEALARGSTLEALPRPANDLLAHVVGASIDPGYRRALRARRLWELAQQGDLVGAAKRVLWSRTQASEVHGWAPPATFGERVREGWELARGLWSHTQFRRTKLRTSSSTSGS